MSRLTALVIYIGTNKGGKPPGTNNNKHNIKSVLPIHSWLHNYNKSVDIISKKIILIQYLPVAASFLLSLDLLARLLGVDAKRA